MKQITLFLFLHLSQAYINLEQCAIDQRSMINVWEERLNDTLMCNYDSTVPPKPLNGSDAIVVKPSFIVKTFQLWSENQFFSIYTWVHISWKDERLQWNPDHFDGISETIMKSNKLWVPGISLHNSYFNDQNYDPLKPCRISKKGGVGCMSATEFLVKCPMDVSDWPFDTQVCSLEFNPVVPRTKIRLDLDPRAVLFIGSEYGAEWSIMDYTQEENQDAEVQIKFNFTLKRHTTSLAAIILFPSILLSVLTLSTLFLDVRCYTRVYVAGFSLMCHFYFLLEMNMSIPKHSVSSPRILFYFRGSVIMTSISIFLTLLMKFLCERKVPITNFIAVLNENVYKSYAKLVIYPRWEVASVATDNDDKRELVKEWTDFASMLNSIWIYISLLVYVVMCCVLIPTPSGLKQKIYQMSYDFE